MGKKLAVILTGWASSSWGSHCSRGSTPMTDWPWCRSTRTRSRSRRGRARRSSTSPASRRSRSTSCPPATSWVTWRPPRRRATSSAGTSRCGRRSSTPTSPVPWSAPTARRSPARTTSSRSTVTPVRRSRAATPTPSRPPTTAGSRRRTPSPSRASTSSSRSRPRRRPTASGTARSARLRHRVQGGRDHRGPRGLPLRAGHPADHGRQHQRPASFFDIDEEGDVTLDRVYSNTRTLWIEPETGVIIRGQEDQLSVAEYEGEQVADPHRRHHRLQPRDDLRQRRHLLGPLHAAEADPHLGAPRRRHPGPAPPRGRAGDAPFAPLRGARLRQPQQRR